MIRICAKSIGGTINEHWHLKPVLYRSGGEKDTHSSLLASQLATLLLVINSTHISVKGFNQCLKLHPATTFTTASIRTMFASSTLAESTTSTCCQLWNLRRQKKRSSLVQSLFHVTLSGSLRKHCLSVKKSLELSHSKHGSLSIPGVRCSFPATCEHQCQLSTSDSPASLTQTSFTFLSCVRSNLRWLLPSTRTRIGVLVTQWWRLMMQTSPVYFCTGITSPPLMMIAWWLWMEDGNLTPPSHDWTHYVMLSATKVSVYFRRISSGMWENALVQSMDKMYLRLRSFILDILSPDA